MGRSKGAAARRRNSAAVRKANAPKISDVPKIPDAPKISDVPKIPDAPKVNAEAPRPCPSLHPDVLANIHDRLCLIDRIAFAAVFAASCDDDLFRLYPPCLVLADAARTVHLFSIADRSWASVLAPGPALRGHFIVGSSRGWLATADVQGQIYLVNPCTGKQHELPHMSTMGVFVSSTKYHDFSLNIAALLTIRYGHAPPFNDHCWGPEGHGTLTYAAGEMCMWFYRKVVPSPSRPGRPGTYSVMLITEWRTGAPAFATSEDRVWKLAPSHDGVEDAIHHAGKFHSISYTGVVEAWERDAESGAYTSTAVAPRLAVEEPKEEGIEPSHRKYLAAAPDGRLMVVIKYPEQNKRPCSFKVHVLGDRGQWKETRDVGDLALFVGMNNSLCVPTRGHPHIKAGSIYYTDDLLGAAELRSQTSTSYSCSSRQGVYSLMDGTAKKIDALGQQSFYPPPAWITPSVP